jgi:hypothetical protein
VTLRTRTAAVPLGSGYPWHGPFHGQTTSDHRPQAPAGHDGPRYSFREVHTDPATGQWFVIRGDGQYKDVQAKPVGGNVFEVTSKNAGQPFVVEDSTGTVRFRFAGVVTFRFLFDTSSDTIPGW